MREKSNFSLLKNQTNVTGSRPYSEKEEKTMMTYREMLTAIVNGEINEEVVEKATERLERLDIENEKRKNRVSKKAAENAPIKEAILAVLTDEPKTATVVGGEVEISTQKASALLRQLVEAGSVVKTDVKVSGKGTQKGYTLA